MHPDAYAKFKATEDQPIEAWETILAQTADAAERYDMQIAINGRRLLDAANETQPR